MISDVTGREVLEDFRNWVTALPDTVGVFVTVGAEDFVLHVAVCGNNHLYALVIDKLTERTEMANVRTSVVYEHLRSDHIAPSTPVTPSPPGPHVVTASAREPGSRGR